MPRIVYLCLSGGGIAGGHKMILRHVETLRDLGFDAVCYIGAQSKVPWWFDHDAPLELGTPIKPDDIVVLPDDGPVSIKTVVDAKLRGLIFTQNPYNFAATSFDIVDQFPPARFPHFIAVGERLAATVRRVYPQAEVSVVPCFADERVFRPAGAKDLTIVSAPRKRPLEAKVIQQMFRRFHPEHSDLIWSPQQDVTEIQMAAKLAGSSLFLSLSRLESVGMTPLEAMASGCVCAGFAGVGGLEYATEENGFWVPDDDCEAAADAVARAAALVKSGGDPLRRHLAAARETAEAWSYARFRTALERVWMQLAPEARLSDGTAPTGLSVA
jgi:hypothetical protein